MARYITGDREVLDDICWRRYRRQDAVPQVLRANPGLADRDPVLPAGVVIELPDLAAPAPPVVRLWGGPAAPAPARPAGAASIASVVAGAAVPAPVLTVTAEGDHRIAAAATPALGSAADGQRMEFALRRRDAGAWGAWSAPEEGAPAGGQTWARAWADLQARTAYQVRARQARGPLAGVWSDPVQATTAGAAPAADDALLWRGAAVLWRGAEVTWARA